MGLLFLRYRTAQWARILHPLTINDTLTLPISPCTISVWFKVERFSELRCAKFAMGCGGTVNDVTIYVELKILSSCLSS